MKLVKIIFELEESELHSHDTESLWAVPLAYELFKIDNVPFYIYGISNGDIVKTISQNDGMFAFAGIH